MNKRTELPLLALADLEKQSDAEIRATIEKNFEITWDASLILCVAFMEEGPWGCDSSAWFLMRRKCTSEFFEAGGSHCSCYGFEGQWKPEATTVKYLLSDKFSGPGSYSEHLGTVKKYLAEHLARKSRTVVTRPKYIVT